MRIRTAGLFALLLLGLSAAALISGAYGAASQWTLIGWNDLGMHCMDGDYSVFSILPPFNTIHAHLIDSTGKLTRSASNVTVTYEAVADPAGSFNTSSVGKTNFWSFMKSFFGVTLPVDTGLKGNMMPGAVNQPQPMAFDAAYNWFSAEGIPMVPYDDTWNKNAYPMMRLVARDTAGNVLATTRIVLPVSDEMDCRACHASGSKGPAKPVAGWIYDSNVERDYKLNILRLHDERWGGSLLYRTALSAAGYPAAGLFASAAGGNPVLCAKCHGSAALSAPGVTGVPPLTSSVHALHGSVDDPVTGETLDSATNRSACYRCHPGSETRCLRGAMGKAVAPDGSMEIQCQDCHGSMSSVGDAGRQGWLQEPNCQACHTGTATVNRGQLRFTNAFEGSGALRQPANTIFATTPNQPAAGLSLYRFSSGHGGLQCSACHGSTHAEWESLHANDNVQSTDIQGFAGPLQECTACHKGGVSTANGGPHGMHNVGAAWVSAHSDAAERNRSVCQPCHGTDYRGTVLSQAFTTRTLSTRFGTIQLWRGYQVSCYTCHNGPSSESSSTSPTPAVSNTSASATSGQTASIPVSITNAGGQATLRIVSQPHGGTATVSGTTITYRAFPDFEGPDEFTYAAFNGAKDSNLGRAAVTVTAPSRPAFTAASVANGASYAAGAISPGMILTVFGSGLGPAGLEPLRLNSGGFVQKALEGTKVLFDGITAPMLYTSRGQIAAVVPYGVAGRSSASMVVEYKGIRSNPVAVPVVAAAPGVFTVSGSGKGQASAANQDGSPNSAANPAARGTVVTFYVTGEGPVTPDGIDGKLTVAPWPAPTQKVTVQIGGQPAGIQYAGAAPGLVAGLMQVNVVVPPGVSPGAVEVTVTVGDAVSAGGVTIQVK